MSELTAEKVMALTGHLLNQIDGRTPSVWQIA